MSLYILVCLILAVVFGGSYYAYRIAFFSPTKDREEIPEVNDPHYTPFKAMIRDLFHALKNKPCEFITEAGEKKKKNTFYLMEIVFQASRAPPSV